MRNMQSIGTKHDMKTILGMANQRHLLFPSIDILSCFIIPFFVLLVYFFSNGGSIFACSFAVLSVIRAITLASLVVSG